MSSPMMDPVAHCLPLTEHRQVHVRLHSFRFFRDLSYLLHSDGEAGGLGLGSCVCNSEAAAFFCLCALLLGEVQL